MNQTVLEEPPGHTGDAERCGEFGRIDGWPAMCVAPKGCPPHMHDFKPMQPPGGMDRAALEALIAQWRQPSSIHMDNDGFMYDAGREQCADELEKRLTGADT